jgi:HPt (histidine-containing phosphotransfer) domain-containing protein
VQQDLSGLDMTAALGRVGGDEELLKEIAQLFLEQWPDSLSDVKRAIEVRDAQALERAAHSLKGSVANFGAKDAHQAALRLEMMGRSGEWAGDLGSALADLERSLQSLCPQLMRLVQG